MTGTCGCGRPLITRPGDLADTCSECRSTSLFCECAPLTSTSNTSNTSNTQPGGLLEGLRDGEWLDKQTFPPVRYPVPGLIPEGFTVLAGRPKAGKSMLVLNMLLAVACGGLAAGRIHTGARRRVLYLALEDGDRRMQERCRHLLASEPIPPLFCYMTSIVPGQVLATIAEFLATYPETAMIVLDTLGKVMPPALQGESSYQRDYKVGGALKAAADSVPGLAVVAVHHDRKAAADDFVDTISGTAGIAGAADTIVVVSRTRGAAEGAIKVTGRDVIEGEYAALFKDGAWELDGITLRQAAAKLTQREETKRLSGLSIDILDFVGAHPSGAETKQIIAKFGGEAAMYLKRLTDAGRLTKPRRGLYAVPALEPSEALERQASGAGHDLWSTGQALETPDGTP